MNRPAAGLGAFASLVESTCSQRNMCGDVQQPTRELQKASAFARSLQIAPEHQVKRHLTGEFVKKYRPTEVPLSLNLPWVPLLEHRLALRSMGFFGS